MAPPSRGTFADRYREYSDQELIDIRDAPAGDYVPGAVEAAREELTRRGVTVVAPASLWSQAAPRILETPAGAIRDPRDPAPRPRPWARYFARQIDSMLVGIVWLPFGIVLASRPLLLLLVWLALWLFLEPLVLSQYVTTPGKAALGLRVEDRDGQLPTYSRALGRTLGLFAAGMGLGLPLVSLIALGASFDHLRATGSTWWDEWSGTRVFTGSSAAAAAGFA